MEDTIFALSTAPGRAGVAIIRISGTHAFDAAKALAGDLPSERHAALRTLRGADGSLIDQGLVLGFGQNRSFTGEESVEFQLHGSPAVVRAVLAELATMGGLRAAEAGEFTRRALENDRLDIAQVEGLSDLIDAETEMQRKFALQVFAGRLGELSEGWREAILHAAALLEAVIDFSDEDVPVDVTPEVLDVVDRMLAEMKKEIDGVGVVERLRDGFEVAIVGKPNVGKSTLLNTLAGREVAITSKIAGTTRDVIEVAVDIDGLPVTFLDTAGLRGTTDEVEGLGVDRAVQRAELADLRIFLNDESGPPADVAAQNGDISVHCKADLTPGRISAVSGVTGEGVDEMVAQVASELTERLAGAGTASRQRHRQAIHAAYEALGRVQAILGEKNFAPELAAENLRGAGRALERLVGRLDVEDVLDRIFSRFCIGK